MEVGIQCGTEHDIGLIYQGLLDFSRDFDVALMDRVVTVFYTSAGQEVPSIAHLSCAIAK
jgi:hypothetical protein